MGKYELEVSTPPKDRLGERVIIGHLKLGYILRIQKNERRNMLSEVDTSEQLIDVPTGQSSCPAVRCTSYRDHRRP